MKSALGPPVKEVNSHLRYGYGIDDITETIIMSVDLGIIKQGGAWFTLMLDGEEKKLQGQEAVFGFLVENPAVLDHLKEEIRGMLNVS